MRILITNFRLAERTASELFVRDVARLLHAGGVGVAVFATRTGELGDDLRKEGIEVSAHPAIHSFKPDLIHGQGNLETMAALLAHPGVPAVFLSSGCRGWREQPPSHPRLLRYLGTTQAVRTWLQRERRISPEKVAALPDLVSVSSTGEARRVPVKPGTALFCDHVPGAGREESLLRRACGELGIVLDTISGLAGAGSARLADRFLRYDLVFARGKEVLEALAAGCGVVPVSDGSFGELVTVDNFDRLSAADFSERRPLKAETFLAAELVAEIEAWDWCKLSSLAGKVRELHGGAAVRNRLLDIYGAVLAEAASQRMSSRSEMPVLADWLIEMAGQHHELDLRALELQQQASVMNTDRKRLNSGTEALLAQLEAEKEKVRLARRLLQDGSVFHQRLKRRIEEGWREIDTECGGSQNRNGARSRKASVDLIG